MPLSASFDLAHLKGMIIDPADPFKFDFIVNHGNEALSPAQKKQEYTKLIKYFLAALAVPDADQWVNLSPYEKNRIIAIDFGKTEMGRDLLAQDYLLKQLSSSLTNPNTALGKNFWNDVYARAYQEFGTRNIPVNTFNKVWIVPDKAEIYEKGNSVYIVSSHLKVMTEEDYLAMKKHQLAQSADAKTKAMNISNQVMRRVIIPLIEQEANEGKNFAPLRQVLSGMLLATWYKKALKESILGRLYANQEKTRGIDQNPQNNTRIYQAYIKAYKKGVYNMIKEEIDPATQEVIPRKYFSGGFYNPGSAAMVSVSSAQAMANEAAEASDLDRVSTRFQNFAMNSKVAGTLALMLVTGGLFKAHGQSVTLAWDPSSDPTVVGYRIYLGTDPTGGYTNVMDVGSNTMGTFSNLVSGTTYYFAATSYTFNGLESPFSGQISYTVPGQDFKANIQANGVSVNVKGNPITAPTSITYQIIPTSDNTNAIATINNSTNTSGSLPLSNYNTATGVLSVPAANNYFVAEVTFSDAAGNQYTILIEGNPTPVPIFSTPVVVNSTFIETQINAANYINPNSLVSVNIYSTDLNGNRTLVGSTFLGSSPGFFVSPLTGGQQFFQGMVDPGFVSLTSAITQQTQLVNALKNPTTKIKSENTALRQRQLELAEKTLADLQNALKKQQEPQQEPVLPKPLGLKKAQPAPITAPTAKPQANQAQMVTPGGIDFTSSNLDMMIRRDGKGVVLPVSQQDLDKIHINGLVPEILDIKPVGNALQFN